MTTENDQIIEKLNTLIRLHAVSLISRLATSKEKIVFLSDAGLSPKDIAEVVGTTPNSVSVTLSKAKKAKKQD